MPLHWMQIRCEGMPNRCPKAASVDSGHHGRVPQRRPGCESSAGADPTRLCSQHRRAVQSTAKRSAAGPRQQITEQWQQWNLNGLSRIAPLGAWKRLQHHPVGGRVLERLLAERFESTWRGASGDVRGASTVCHCGCAG